MTALSAFLAFLAGMALPTQAAVNGQLRVRAGDPVLAAFLSFLAGTIVLAAWVLIARVPVPITALAGMPAWMWLGGPLGVVYVAATIFLIPRLGAGALVALAVAGQILFAMTLDHFGWLGLRQHPINGLRALGALLLVGGVILVRLF